MSNKLAHMARELLAVSEDAELRINKRCTGRTVNDFEIHTFVQTWGSTALGFGGIGGCAITSARTYVLIPYEPSEMALVYFGSGFAYEAPWGEAFVRDVENQEMEPVFRKGKYFTHVRKEVEEQCQR